MILSTEASNGCWTHPLLVAINKIVDSSQDFYSMCVSSSSAVRVRRSWPNKLFRAWPLAVSRPKYNVKTPLQSKSGQ